MSEAESISSFFGILPSDLRADMRVTYGAKVLYAEITAMTCGKSKFAWASNSSLGRAIGGSARSASRWISELETCGYIRVDRTYDDSQCRKIWPIIGLNTNPDKSGVGGEPNLARGLDKNVHQSKIKEEREIEVSDKRASDLAKAIEIYNTYPRKIARPVALKAILKASEKIALDDLHGHVKEYADAVATWPKEQRKFVPHPASWINQERWNDERSEWYRNLKPKQQSYSRPEYREMPTAN